MEEFKKPCLPITTPKVENPKVISQKPTEIPEKNNESSASTTIKPQVPVQLCPYKIPQWSDRPGNENNYSFEVLKSGQIIDEIKELQNKAYWTFGRLPENDIEMAHPTISRFHAILQYRPKSKHADNLNDDDEGENKDKSENNIEDKSPPEGWYIYDLDSTHGTFLNKQRVPAKVYIRVRVGHMIRLGASTRSYILQGPSEDEEPVSELSITELKAKRQQDLEQAALDKKRLADEAIERANNEGCSWGMGEDADEETDLTHNPYASSNNEELFLDDPKKTLRGYFEREGLELVYKCDEMSAGSFVCRVELPIDDANGRPIVAEVVHKGKKKDCVVQCALEACRVLDRHGVLRQANQEPLKRKQKSQDSGSDDEFWDRTGDVARKKQRKANANTSVTLTYEDLLKQENEIEEKTKQIQSKIQEYQEQQQRLKEKKSEEGEDLDAFMKNLQGNEMQLDKTEIRKLRLEEQRLKSEKQRVQRLIKIAKPIDLPFSKPTTNDTQSEVNEKSAIKKQLPMIGKRNQFSKFKIVKMETTSSISKPSKPAKFLDSDEEEIEENEKHIKFNENKSTNDMVSDIVPTDEGDDNTAEVVKEIISKMPNNEEVKEIPLTMRDSESNESLKQINDENCPDIKEKSIEGLHDTAASVEENISESGNSNKKRRHRIRQRGKRQEVDMMEDDVEYESSDKYAKWVPPENQTGDGFTELNKKFGY